ncbi:MAG: alpha-mannosidase, partial [Eubacteriales bacterium]|nr:alpha-mannosidase [Eubacteriales bacterium]
MYLKLYERCGQILRDLDAKRLREDKRMEIEGLRFHPGDLESQNRADFDASSWPLFEKDQIWGTAKREIVWFDLPFEVPAELQNEDLLLVFETDMGHGWEATNPQFTVYIDGKIRQALDTNHRMVYLHRDDYQGKHRLSLRAYSGEDDGRCLRMRVYFQAYDRALTDFFYNFSGPYQTLALMNPDSEDYFQTLNALNDAVNCLDLRRFYSPEFYQGLQAANEMLETAYYEKLCDSKKKPLVRAVGHTHIDIAWLWTLAVTADKSVRSFSTVLELMRQFDDYIFMSSQAQLYQYVERLAPDLLEEIKERVREGRWEVEGATWVEPDCNLSSGEGLVRQFLYGQRFFREHFDKTCRILWLPDVFGYSAALPQIIKKSGCDYFMTTKIAWNDTNRLPYDSFEWKGIDGSRVLTHFAPTREYNRLGDFFPSEVGTFTTYNGMLNETQVKGAWQRYGNKDLNSEVLSSYGWGDGGGGTTVEMIERGRRLQRGLRGLPRVQFSTALDFFKKLEADVSGKRDLPVWDGELYFEYHRATLTSMAENKRNNRHSEFALQDAETLSLWAQNFAAYNY